ncbi:hypothetical protein HOF92_09140 [bacterium]|jgi:hypothetical protein|nr:hypothetical protein [bacterium]
MRESPLATLEETEEALQEILRELPKEQRNSLLDSIDQASPDETLDLLLREFDKSRGTQDSFKGSTPSQSVDLQPESPNKLLSKEEKDFFFQPLDSVEEPLEEPQMDDLENEDKAQLLEHNREIFDEVMVTPLLDDARRLQYINMGILSLVLCIMGVVGWLQYDNNRQMAQNNEFLKYSQERRNAPVQQNLWTFWEQSEQDQQRILLQKLDSNLATKKEKLFSFYMLATLEFQRGNFSEGRRYMLEGMKLRDEN